MLCHGRPFPLVDGKPDGKKHTLFSSAAPNSRLPIHGLLDRLILAPHPPANAIVLLPATFDSQLCLVSHLKSL